MLYTVNDLSGGIENVPLKALNRYTFDKIPGFNYIATVQVTPELENQFPTVCCQCTDSTCSAVNCACWVRQTYLRQYCDTSKCSCSTDCKNRVGNLFTLKLPFQVYFVNPDKGWAVRCEIDIPKETFVFEYAGVLMKDKEFDVKNDYLFYFEYEDRKYVIDGCENGNVARFVNHACQPNLKAQIIVGEHRIPHVVFSALHYIPRGAELTFNYGPMWWGPNANLKCLCGYENCEYKTETLETDFS